MNNTYVAAEYLKMPYYRSKHNIYSRRETTMSERVFLSPPYMSGKELGLIQQAFADNWIAPAGPHLAAFEKEFCEYTGSSHAVALSSGTAAIHLALLTMGIQ